MLLDAFRALFWREFNSIHDGAAYFHVRPVTVKRWLDGSTPPNPMAEKLLIIKARGYLPNDLNWQGFKVNEARAVIITPDGREFAPRELEAFPLWRDQYHALKDRYGLIERPPVKPAAAPVTIYRGGKRKQPAPWIPTRDKMK
ncbi:phage protein [Grimontia marina]|uniref:S-adenosylhomocysteine hydrolase n=1 Tax=Grimontia marina TaxID=646534 RepID=A0A128EXY8_9GAMM|nr:phage protein [Grimontia marina]CZF79438.1 hypothetical protein GMA8713_00973 [Grimontia marina]